MQAKGKTPQKIIWNRRSEDMLALSLRELLDYPEIS
jgi:hypothetical protein